MLYIHKQSFKKKSPFWLEFETIWSNNKITSFHSDIQMAALRASQYSAFDVKDTLVCTKKVLSLRLKKTIIFAGLLCWTAYCCTGSPLPVSSSYNPDYWKLDLHLWGILLAFSYCDWQIHKLNSLKFNRMQVCIKIVIDLVTQ